MTFVNFYCICIVYLYRISYSATSWRIVQPIRYSSLIFSCNSFDVIPQRINFGKADCSLHSSLSFFWGGAGRVGGKITAARTPPPSKKNQTTNSNVLQSKSEDHLLCMLIACSFFSFCWSHRQGVNWCSSNYRQC